MLAIYTRVSSDEQAENGLSLDNQAARGKELAAKLAIKYEIYEDAGLSGSITFNKRPALNRLILDIYNGKVTVVFVTALDRLTRGGIYEHTGLMNIFKEEKVRLFELESENKLNDINVELLNSIKALLAAFELAKTSARVKTVLEANAINGKLRGCQEISCSNIGFMV